jgi:hypothetical protein
MTSLPDGRGSYDPRAEACCWRWSSPFPFVPCRRSRREPSPFASRELSVTPSPASASELTLPAGSLRRGLRPLAHRPGRAHPISTTAPATMWLAGTRGEQPHPPTSRFTCGLLRHASIAVHPIGHRFFVGGKTGQQSRILVVDNLNGTWTRQHHLPVPARPSPSSRRPATLCRSAGTQAQNATHRELPPLLRRTPTRRRVFSTRSITEDGQREYQVIGPQASYTTLPNEDEPPTPNFVSSAPPSGISPGRAFADLAGRQRLLPAACLRGQRTGTSRRLSPANPCGGSLTVTPNGAALLHWKSWGAR